MFFLFKNNKISKKTNFLHPNIIIIVGQNENIIRQQVKESGVEASPVLVPSSVPRITDVPRINGKGGIKIFLIILF